MEFAVDFQADVKSRVWLVEVGYRLVGEGWVMLGRGGRSRLVRLVKFPVFGGPVTVDRKRLRVSLHGLFARCIRVKNAVFVTDASSDKSL